MIQVKKIDVYVELDLFPVLDQVLVHLRLRSDYTRGRVL